MDKTNLLLSLHKVVEGEAVKKNITLTRVRSDLTSPQILQVAQAISSLIDWTVVDVQRVDYTSVS